MHLIYAKPTPTFAWPKPAKPQTVALKQFISLSIAALIFRRPNSNSYNSCATRCPNLTVAVHATPVTPCVSSSYLKIELYSASIFLHNSIQFCLKRAGVRRLLGCHHHVCCAVKCFTAEAQYSPGPSCFAVRSGPLERAEGYLPYLQISSARFPSRSQRCHATHSRD